MRTYVDTYRRTLLDMHIPDWDPAFLSKYDPVALADSYAPADIEGVLLYCKSHIGLNYWPAPVGAVHAQAKERDLVGKLVTALVERGLKPAAYHSVIFDNWAVETHPEWRQVSAETELGFPNSTMLGPHYGIACPNHPRLRRVRAHPNHRADQAVIVDNKDTDLRVELRFDPQVLPAVFQWKMAGEGEYVLGIEPANTAVLGRRPAEESRQLPMLPPRSSKTYTLQFDFSVSANH